MKISIYNLEGKEVKKMEISKEIFGLSKNNDLVHQVAVSIMANRRQVLAHTKTRGERAGSGRKPWKQKGTGRARVGSVRTPIWKKGGIVFGPRSERNFKKKINKKMNAKAIAIVLSGKLKENEIYAVDNLKIESKKTKEFSKFFENLKIKGKTLAIFGSGERDFRIASRNIKNCENSLVEQLNVLDMLNNKYLLISEDSIKELEKKYNKADE
ncbi:MAG TPA: 50S ribosomal protein L4 [Candidatus Moranbacteria bacterium]|nr:50S ribosomal protein L4 [Candidatus Moranbacteria bacterium]